MSKVLVTGGAGFIGFHLIERLLERGDTVVSIDNINDYYDVNLKFARLLQLGISKESAIWNKKILSHVHPKFSFRRMNLEDSRELDSLFEEEKFESVCNLAAQAGVRYSLENPKTYINSNIVGFFNILDACKRYDIKHLVYASSSSVYGNNKKMPLSVTDKVDHPISLYAATKKSNELMAHTYSHLYNLPTTGLRFFTVYGPWGRPDMAPFKFTKYIAEDKPIKIYNNGDMYRDFTYIDDIIEGVVRVLGTSPITASKIPYKLYNIGNSQPIKLMDFILTLENCLNKTAKKEYLPMQPGDVWRTEADISELENDLHYKPSISLSEGIGTFIEWYKEFYKL